MQAFAGIWGLEDFYSPPGRVPPPPLCLGKRRYMWEWGSQHQAAFEKAKILVKQIKALAISPAGLPFELRESMTLEVRYWALWQRQEKERVPRGFWSQL